VWRVHGRCGAPFQLPVARCYCSSQNTALVSAVVSGAPAPGLPDSALRLAPLRRISWAGARPGKHGLAFWTGERSSGCWGPAYCATIISYGDFTKAQSATGKEDSYPVRLQDGAWAGWPSLAPFNCPLTALLGSVLGWPLFQWHELTHLFSIPMYSSLADS
jgi:hypothetical protein